MKSRAFSFLLVAFMLSALISCKKDQLTPTKTNTASSGGLAASAAIVRPTVAWQLPTSDAFIGIRWNTDNDINLYFIDSATGRRYTNYEYNGEITFSGDQFTGYGISGFAGRELFYATTYFRPVLIKVRYHNGGDSTVNFNVYMGKEHITNLTGNYKVSNANIWNAYDTDITGINTLKTIGYVLGDKLYIYQ